MLRLLFVETFGADNFRCEKQDRSNLDLALAAQSDFIDDERDTVPHGLNHVAALAPEPNHGVLLVARDGRNVSRDANAVRFRHKRIERRVIRVTRAIDRTRVTVGRGAHQDPEHFLIGCIAAIDSAVAELS